MDFKRNIFESSAKMPERNETCSAAIFDKKDEGYIKPYYENPDYSVRHAPIPRIGDQK